MRQFKYKQNGSQGMGHNPMIPIYDVDLGKDKNGNEWICRITPSMMETRFLWNVDFDTNDEYEAEIQPEWRESDELSGRTVLSVPFLRPEVVYCKDGQWGKANRERYHRKTVAYKDIYKTICEFVDAHCIN